MGEKDQDWGPPAESVAEGRVQVAAEIGDEIRQLEEQLAGFWKRRIVGLGFLGVVTIALAVVSGELLLSGVTGVFTIGIFFAYQAQGARLKRRKFEAEGTFEALTPSAGVLAGERPED